MPTWTFRPLRRAFVALAAAALGATPAGAEVVTQLPTTAKVVALTFDACEGAAPAHLDRGVADWLVAEKIPFTVFMGGKFARDNPESARWLAAQPFVEIENHSWSHPQHMERLDQAGVQREVRQAEDEIAALTGRRTRLFRFPAGNYDAASLRAVEDLGYTVVHWSFASGDPVRAVTPAKLTDWVLGRTKPGNILIFHINGRGWSTAAALPGIVADLKRRGYAFARVDQVLGTPTP